MTEIEKLEATVKELAETVKHTVDEQSALCMRVNLLEEGGKIISPVYNDQYAVLSSNGGDEGYIVSIFVNKSGLCEYAPCDGDDLHSEHCTTMLDAMQEYQKCLHKIRSGPPYGAVDDKECTTPDGYKFYQAPTGEWTDGDLTINNSSDLAIAVANDEVVHPSIYPMHFISSCGEVYVNADGTINEKSKLSDYLLNIVKFDMEEFWSWDQRVGLDSDCGDTLELAYWDNDGVYHQPDWSYREHICPATKEDAKQAIEKQKSWIRTYRPLLEMKIDTMRPQEKREPMLRYVWVEYNVINWEDGKPNSTHHSKWGAVFPPVVVDDPSSLDEGFWKGMKEGDMRTEHYAEAWDGEHSMNDTHGKPVGIPCSYSRCYMVTRKTDEEILKDFIPKWFVDDPCDEAGNLPPPEPEPKRFKIYGLSLIHI